jgi:glutamine synthetase adenylyltransferase
MWGNMTVNDGLQQESAKRSIEAVRNQAVRLATALSAAKCLASWSEAAELRRCLQRAASVVRGISARETRCTLFAELRVLGSAVRRLLAMAPRLDEQMLMQARSLDPYLDRTALTTRIEQWHAASVSKGVPVPVFAALTRPTNGKRSSQPARAA